MHGEEIIEGRARKKAGTASGARRWLDQGVAVVPGGEGMDQSWLKISGLSTWIEESGPTDQELEEGRL